MNAVSVYVKKETAAAFSEKEVQIEVLTDSKTSLNGVLRKSDYGYMGVLSEGTVKPGDRIRIVSK
ncbi:MAG: hypothetical protein J6O39_05885 [Treponema sp.]|nr:hypothetical protein [Treponema sp.]